MEQYGDFLINVDSMERALGETANVWTDEVGRSYMRVNDNIYDFTKKMWKLFDGSKQGYEVVKQNYNQSDIDAALSQLYYELVGLR